MARLVWLTFLAVPVAFAAGWVLRAHPRGELRATAEAPSAAAVTCVDPAAMDANRNLVGQVVEANARLAKAAEAARDARAALTAREGELPGALRTPADEWTKMASDGRLRLRMPCAAFGGSSRVVMQRPGGRFARSSRPSDAAARAAVAGLSPEEVAAVDELYAREHARTWAKMKATCAALAPPREQGEREAEKERELTAYDNIDECRGLASSNLAKATISRVAGLHAAGAAPSSRDGPQVQALFVLGGAGEELTRALVGVLGREKAGRALAYGAICVDDALLWGADPESPT